MTPKSLLRLPEARSSLTDMDEGTRFQRVIGDNVCVGGPHVKRLVLCSGKIYYELLSTRKEKEMDDTVAIVRVEQVRKDDVEIHRSEMCYNRRRWNGLG